MVQVCPVLKQIENIELLCVTDAIVVAIDTATTMRTSARPGYRQRHGVNDSPSVAPPSGDHRNQRSS